METKDFADFLAVLNSEGTVYVVIGGMALTANGEQGSLEKFQQWATASTVPGHRPGDAASCAR